MMTCWVVAGVCLSASLEAQKKGVEVDRDSGREVVRNELLMLAPPSEEMLRKFVAGLSAEEFEVRKAARERLQGAPMSWVPFLEKIKEENEDPEVRLSLAHLLKNLEPRDRSSTTDLARAILTGGYRGLAVDSLLALQAISDRKSAELLMGAARLSANDEEKKKVIGLLSFENALVREGAVRVIDALMDDPREILAPSLEDADGLVCLATAEVFARRADPACLNPLRDMLGGDDFFLRFRASGMLQLMTEDEVQVNPLQPVHELDLEKWRKPGALNSWKPSDSFPQVSLFKENDNLSSWTLARGDLIDVPKIESQPDSVSFLGTGGFILGSPLRFQNYRVTMEWLFPWERKDSNGGFSLCQFEGPTPDERTAWGGRNAVEIDIKRRGSGRMYPSPEPTLLDGTKAPWEVGIDNENREAWSTLTIEERDGILRVWVNGLLQSEASDRSEALTSFGLRVDGSPISWRNLTLEPLPGARVASSPEVEVERNENE